jgi:hypothetical protein
VLSKNSELIVQHYGTELVGEHSKIGEVKLTKIGGDFGRDSAGTSSDKQGENPCRRKPKVS